MTPTIKKLEKDIQELTKDICFVTTDAGREAIQEMIKKKEKKIQRLKTYA